MSPAPSPRTDNGLHLRAACMDDVDDITAMLDAATQRWAGRPTTPEETRDRLTTSHTSIDTDTVLVADDGGTVIGFGHVWPAQPDEIRGFGRTHPDHRGRGVGLAIQRFLIQRATALATSTPAPEQTELTCTTSPSDIEAEGLLTTLGYRPVRYFQKMVIDLSQRQLVAVPAPTGVEIRGYREATDEPVIFGAYVDAFATHWGDEHPDEEAWWDDHRDGQSAGYDPDLWQVAMDGDQLAGFVTSRIQQDIDGRSYGYVGDLGVRPQWRGRGLGEALLTGSIAMLRDRGMPYVALHVDTENTSGAVRLYTKVGMEARPSFTIWSIRLSPT